MLFRIKNELDNHPRKTVRDRMIQLSENKSTGIVEGVSDFCLVLHDGRVAWIELKIPGGQQSPDQKVWEVKLLLRGHQDFICWSVDEFIELCKKLLYGTI